MSANAENVFKNELAFFNEDSDIKNLVLEVMRALPDAYSNESLGVNVEFTRQMFQSSVEILNTEYLHTFTEQEKEAVFAAILLQNGFLSEPIGEDRKHLDLMIAYLSHNTWDQYCPPFIREVITDVLGCFLDETKCKSHPENIAVTVCRNMVLKMLKTETACSDSLDTGTKDSDSKTPFPYALRIAKQLIRGKMWDGHITFDSLTETSFAILDGEKYDVPEDLVDALIMLGQTHMESIKKVDSEHIVHWNEFVSKYPDWDRRVYGNPPDSLFIVSGGKNIPVSKRQAEALGVIFNR